MKSLKTLTLAAALLAVPALAAQAGSKMSGPGQSEYAPGQRAQQRGSSQGLCAGPAHAQEGRQGSAGRIRIRAGTPAEQGREAVSLEEADLVRRANARRIRTRMYGGGEGRRRETPSFPIARARVRVCRQQALSLILDTLAWRRLQSLR